MSRYATYKGKQSKVLWPLAVIVGLVPLIVRLKEVKLPEVVKEFWDNGSGTYADFFSVNKLILLGIAVAFGIGLFMLEYRQIKLYKGTNLERRLYNNKIIFGLTSVYAGFAILSTVFAAKGQKYLALFGAPGRYEGLITILCYIGSMLLAIYVAQDARHIKVLYKVLVVQGLISGFIGIGQFLGHDLFETLRGKLLMLPYAYQHLAHKVNFSFNGRVYGTFFNPNYVGSYGAMLMPLSMVGMIYTYTYKKELGKKLIATLFAITMFILWVIPLSRGGLLGGGFALVLIFLLLFKRIINSKGRGIALIGLLIATFVMANHLSDGVILKRMSTLPKQASDFFAKNDKPVRQLEDIKLEEDAVEIISNLPPIRIEREEEQLILKDKGGQVIPTVQEKATMTSDDPDYPGLVIVNNLPESFRVRIANPGRRTYTMNFVPTSEGMRIIGSNGVLLTIEPVESWGFKGKENLGSSRGYIWSRTLPMIKDTWLLGYGPDTYVVNFPQHDVIGKTLMQGSPNIIVDKPHNLYLQIMTATGFISLLAFLGLIITYSVLCFKHIRRTDPDDIGRWMSIGIFAAVCGYLVAGMFNDSIVAVAPIFWIILGLGIGLTDNSEETA